MWDIERFLRGDGKHRNKFTKKKRKPKGKKKK